MRKLIVSTYTTLDGVMNPVDWSALRSGDQDRKYSHDLLFSSDLLLMGRATYEFFPCSGRSHPRLMTVQAGRALPTR